VAADAATAADDLSTGSVSSGRTDNWSAMFRDWRHNSVLEEAFGNIDNTRGYPLRQPASVKSQPKLTADNAGISELRRGGVLGVLAFLLGFVLLFCRPSAAMRQSGGDYRSLVPSRRWRRPVRLSAALAPPCCCS